MRTSLAAFVGFTVLSGCEPDEVVWTAFNAEGQTLVVDVLPIGNEIGEARSLDLLSNLGRTVVGVGAVDPGSGPVGTTHLVTVDVFDEFEDRVGRVSVLVDSEAVEDLDGDGTPDSRGEGEFEMRRDSADPGAFAISVQSLGADDETRADRFTLLLWQPDVLAETADLVPEK